MRADLRALVGIEEALEQSAEDRRVDQAPVEARGGEQQADLDVFERERRAAVEQAAVELGDVLEIEVAAVLHVGEQLLEPWLALLRLALGRLQQLPPDAVRQQVHAVGEEAEHELVDEMRDRLAVGIAVLERSEIVWNLSAASLVSLARVRPERSFSGSWKDRVEGSRFSGSARSSSSNSYLAGTSLVQRVSMRKRWVSQATCSGGFSSAAA